MTDMLDNNNSGKMTTANDARFDFEAFTHQTRTTLQADIKTLFDYANLPEPLIDACYYVMMGGGKRVRPLLVASSYLTIRQTSSPTAQSLQSHYQNACYQKPAIQDASTPNADNKNPDIINANVKNNKNALKADVTQFYFNDSCRRAMLAVELLHTYSLVHDDLPCMDDDDLRRGRPTCHIKFDEATALLTGDILQTLAFEVLMPELAGFSAISEQQVASLLSLFSPRARRMVSGQMLDLNAENTFITQLELESIHKDKTGALIEASILMGGVSSQATATQLDALQQFAVNIGIAFQVQDDILDVTSSTGDLGKPVGSDEKLNKSTYVKLMGVEAANHYANSLFKTGTESIVQTFGLDNSLMALANWLWHRQK